MPDCDPRKLGKQLKRWVRATEMVPADSELSTMNLKWVQGAGSTSWIAATGPALYHTPNTAASIFVRTSSIVTAAAMRTRLGWSDDQGRILDSPVCGPNAQAPYQVIWGADSPDGWAEPEHELTVIPGNCGGWIIDSMLQRYGPRATQATPAALEGVFNADWEQVTGTPDPERKLKAFYWVPE